jgi:two-component system sensor histidine kinase UhpB
MTNKQGKDQSLKHRLTGFSICARIAIANAVIITVGAAAGTIITRSLKLTGQVLPYTILIITAGVGLSIAASFLVTRLALRPLFELRRVSEKATSNTVPVSTPFQIPNPDPDTCQVASALNSLIAELETSNRQLKIIRSRSIGAQEEERKRIARWLHDDTGQALAVLILQLDRLIQIVPEAQPEIRSQIATASERADQILKELRKIIQGLRPAILDDLGLVPAIRWYARTTLEEAGIRVTIHEDENEIALPPELSITLFRTAQEAINNVARHSHANQAFITIRRLGNEIYLGVEDDGRGFQVAGDADEAIRKRHWGLIGIQERLDRVGGSFSLLSEPSRGTLLQVYVPLPKNEEVIYEPENSHIAG